ncbi:MAG: type II toxin-antitoxin system VapC family toxin [Deltaproteobacteria bacterium]|nr:type II toxin-antitoxin system VapC family toxin [Deltaproteobacteria bacterium]
MLKIIDASVAIKWFLREEKGMEAALKILDMVAGNPKNFAVPDLFFDEMLSVLCRLLNDAKAINTYMKALQELGLMCLSLGAKTVSTAVELAKKYNLGGYDAIYVANAKLTGGVWLTADHRAHSRIVNLGLSKLVA